MPLLGFEVIVKGLDKSVTQRDRILGGWVSGGQLGNVESKAYRSAASCFILMGLGLAQDLLKL